MKQKTDKPDAKESWRARFCQNMLSLHDYIDICVWILIVGTIILFLICLGYAASQNRAIKQTIPAEQQPMIEIPIERTVCVKPAEGYCMEYRTNRIRTP